MDQPPRADLALRKPMEWSLPQVVSAKDEEPEANMLIYYFLGVLLASFIGYLQYL